MARVRIGCNSDAYTSTHASSCSLSASEPGAPPRMLASSAAASEALVERRKRRLIALELSQRTFNSIEANGVLFRALVEVADPVKRLHGRTWSVLR